MVINEVKVATADSTLGGGGFKARIYGIVEDSKRVEHGPQVRVCCAQCYAQLQLDKKAALAASDQQRRARNGAALLGFTDGCSELDLMWNAIYEQADDLKWYLLSSNDSHYKEHPLSQHEFEMRAEGMGDDGGGSNVIPHDYLKEALCCRRAGMKPRDIMNFLETKANEEGRGIQWTYQHLLDRLTESKLVRKQDGAGYAAWLDSRAANGYPAGYRVNDALELSLSYAVFEMADEVWATGSRVLLFDPVHGTNQYGHYFAAFNTVDENGVTQMLMYVTLDDKTPESYRWAFSVFAKVFRLPPILVGTDSEAAILSALDDMCEAGNPWEECKLRILCIFHISKNFYEHIHPLYVGNKEGFRTVSNTFWRTSKESDASSTERWEPDWQRLVALVRDTANASAPTYTSGIQWLEKLGGRGETFAYRFTWRHFSAGINSTQRGEAKNSGLKAKALAAHLSLKTMGSKAVTYSADCHLRGKTSAVALKRRFGNDKPGPLLHAFLKVVTPYAYSLVKSRAARADFYKVVEEGSGSSRQFRVTVLGTATQLGDAEAPEFDGDGVLKAHEDEDETCMRFDRNGRVVSFLDMDSKALLCSCQVLAAA